MKLETWGSLDQMEDLMTQSEDVLRARLLLDATKIQTLENEKTLLQDSICSLKKEIYWLQGKIKDLQQQHYGRKTERALPQKGQLTLPLFNEVEVVIEREAQKQQQEEQKKTPVKAYERERGKRRPLPENLPREVRVIDLSDEQKAAYPGGVLRCIGKEVCEKLEYTPASLKVIEYQRLKYEVLQASGESEIAIAAPVASLIPKSYVTPSLLAGLITQKYALGVPLYRQAELFKWMGVDLPRSSQARWMVQAAQACQVIWNLLEEKLFASSYIACDETYTQVLKEKGKAAQSTSYMWVRSTPSERYKIVLFTYDPSRAGAVAEKLFKDYQGYLQVDGYAGYNSLESRPTLKRVGCAMHARRKFFKAKVQEAGTQGTLAEQGIGFFQMLYQIEESVKNLSDEERYQVRQEKAQPIWNHLHRWAKENLPKVLPRSKIAGAFSYLLNEFPYLTRYLEAGYLNIDNGFTERAIRYFAIGRNNWIFSDTVQGAEASSLLYSLVVTARVNGINPLEALTKIFTELPLATSLADYERITNYLLIKPPQNSDPPIL